MDFFNFLIITLKFVITRFTGDAPFTSALFSLVGQISSSLASAVFIFYNDLLTKFSWVGFLLIYCLILMLDLLLVPKSVFEVRLTALWNANWLFLCGAVVYFWYKKLVFSSTFEDDVNTLPFFFMERLLPVFPEINLFFHIGIDGVSLWLILLTLFLLPICILLSWEVITVRVKLYYFLLFFVIFLFVMLIFRLGFIFLLCFFREFVISNVLADRSMGFAIERKIVAAYKFFFYTFVGSIFFLVALLLLYSTFGTMDYIGLIYGLLYSNVFSFSLERQLFVFFAFMFSFGVKLPMFPVHLWLPEAHVEASTAGSVLLAGILLKMGGYGILSLHFGFVARGVILVS